LFVSGWSSSSPIKWKKKRRETESLEQEKAALLSALRLGRGQPGRQRRSWLCLGLSWGDRVRVELK